MRLEDTLIPQGERSPGYEQRELVCQGHEACPGCGAVMALRIALKALGPETVLVLPTSCMTFSLGAFPLSALKVPAVHSALGTAAACASGIRAALDLEGRRGVTVMGWAGDEGLMGIGLAHLIRAARREERIIMVCCDNLGSASIGSGDASDRAEPSRVMKENGASYFATATPAMPLDLTRKFMRAASRDGFRMIHVLAACPGRWGIDPAASVEAMRSAVLSGRFPLYEWARGENPE